MIVKFLCIGIFSLLSALVSAATLETLTTIDDGLDPASAASIQDDYIRLTLLTPSYQQANAIKVAIENWLGPNMVRLESSSRILIQAPRDPSQRVSFLAALMSLEVDSDI